MRQALGVGGDDAQAAAAVGIDNHAFRRGDGNLRAAAPQVRVDLFRVVEDLDGGAEAFLVQVALVLGEPQGDVEHRARDDCNADVGRGRGADQGEEQGKECRLEPDHAPPQVRSSGLRRMPMPFTSTSTTSPAFMKSFGLRP